MSPATLTAPAAPLEEPLYEVVNGQKVELPPMSAKSTWLASRIQNHTGSFAEEKGLGTVVTEMLFVLDREANIRRRPDVAFISADRWPVDQDLPWQGDWDVIPDLAVEVISPNDTFSDVERKVGEYLDHGVRQVWVVSPAEQRVYIYESRDSIRSIVAPADLDTPLLPGWRLPLTSLFRTSGS